MERFWGWQANGTGRRLEVCCCRCLSDFCISEVGTSARRLYCSGIGCRPESELPPENLGVEILEPFLFISRRSLFYFSFFGGIIIAKCHTSFLLLKGILLSIVFALGLDDDVSSQQE